LRSDGGDSALTNASAVERLMKKAKADLKKGNAQSAAQNYGRAYELNPKNQNSLVGYASAMMKLGNAAEALRAGVAAIQAAPSHLEALKISAAAALQLRDWRSLLQISEKWRTSYPDDVGAVRSLAFAYFELGEPDKARDIYGELIEANPRSAEYLAMYSRLCLAAFDYDGAGSALEKAHVLAPPTAESLYALARVKMFMGALEESERLCTEAIDKNPNFAPSFAQYTTLRGGDVTEEIKTQISQLVVTETLPSEHKASLYFALGDIHHFKEEYSDAMRSYDSGDQISGGIFEKEGLKYDPANFERQRECEKQFFREIAAPMSFSSGPARPIFVVGMPRSGTTLVESILAAHPDVFGAGELGELPVIHNDALGWSERNGGSAIATASKAQLQSWRDRYFKSYPAVKEERFVVDKQPLNFRAVGLIKTLFPEAIIIHIRRNPIDTGFSIYKNDFGKAWPYATSLENIAHFYGEYARLAAYWEGRMGEAFPLFQYEELIADFELHVRRLLKLCDLEWRDECLEFHRVKRPVATFSTTQVRQPVRKTIVSTKTQYGDLLQPLIDGLMRAGVDLETGALAIR
jgi:tetratricopeptide (TPR) repeat protein